MSRKPKTYLCGPIGLNVIKNAREWREMVTKKLTEMDIEALDPFDNVGNNLQDVRKDLHEASDNGDIEGARFIVSKFFIPPDLKMVKTANFLTVYIPKRIAGNFDYQYLRSISDDDYAVEEYILDKIYEVCGSYGEATVAKMFGKPVYIVTDRPLKPIGLPHWLVGCTTEIFTNWDDYFKFVKKEWES